MKCIKGFDVKVLHSNAGYYIGTLDDMESPNCRVSVGYYRKEQDAQNALKNNSFANRECMENRYCNGGGECGIR
jgi:hypothetical protein